jgi:hypothetical protein
MAEGEQSGGRASDWRASWVSTTPMAGLLSWRLPGTRKLVVYLVAGKLSRDAFPLRFFFDSIERSREAGDEG